ncbi:hypothetical protein J6590_010823 [Homalodisca vitripennis]|nr:hypothetical protein J6590_010823 [Homalodisca vitripennis]
MGCVHQNLDEQQLEVNVCRVPHKLADSPSITSTSPDPPAAKAPDQSERAIHLVINEVHGAFRLLKACHVPYTWLRQHRCRRITAGFTLMHIQAVAELLSLSPEVALTPIFSYINPDGT